VKLAVIGAGAMGGSLAGHAARAGHEVTVVDAAPAVIEQVSTRGLEVETPEGSFTARPAVTDDAATASPMDVVVVFVKAQHTEQAAKSLQPLLGPETAVVTLQNGWGNADRLAQFVPGDQLVIGVTYNSCTSRGPGRITHSARGRTIVGPYQDSDLSRAWLTARLLSDSGWEAEANEDVLTEIWKKLVLNAATLPTAALSRLGAGAVGEPGQLLDLVDGLAAEAVAVAAAQGLDITRDERVSAIHGVLARAGSGKASMLQDVLAGRKTEIETINGAIVSAGAARGVPVPLNEAMVALVHGLERSYLS
jgi:2-dehydropantoate 2-reductase